MSDWQELSKKEALKRVDSSEEGLSDEEAGIRLSKYGANKIEEVKKKNLFVIFLHEFNSWLIYILLIAAVVSFFIQHYLDAGVILAIVVINALIGFFQEYKAEKIIEDLKKVLGDKSIVLREGKQKEISNEEIVIGDILVLKEGEKVPADCRILNVTNLETNEAILTGESFPVDKTDSVLKENTEIQERKNLLFSGSVIVRGNCTALVVSTGKETEFGKIAGLVQKQEEEKMPFEKKLDSFSKKLSLIAIGFTVLVFLIGIYLQNEIHEMFLTAVSMAIAAIPEGLPAVIAISFAVAIKAMHKENVLIRKLPAAESLGAVDVICVDKTGTLTEERLSVDKIYSGKFYSFKEKVDKNLDLLIKTGILCNNARQEEEEILGDPTETALIELASKFGFKKKLETEENPRVKEFSFTSERKVMSIVREEKGGKIKTSYVKGAPSFVLEKCTKELKNGKVVLLSKERKKELEEIYNEIASEGLRVLGFAIKQLPGKKGEIKLDDAEEHLTFVGFVGMLDPPRKEVRQAIEEAKEAGIEIKILTGDAKETSIYVAHEIGLKGEVIQGKELDLMDESQLRAVVLRATIFTRITPQHKLKIVQILKEEGKIVAVTGDGVNDILALKKADIGIAMGIRGADVARDSSEIVLLDDNFASIIKGIKQGRRVYDNLKKSIKFHLAANFYIYLVVAFSLLFTMPLPLLPLAILWMNLVTDALPSIAFAAEPAEEEIMKRKPKRENILSGIGLYIISAGIIAFMIIFGVFIIALQKVGLDIARTMTMTTAIFFELFFAFSCKSEHNGLKYIFNNKYLTGAVVISICLHLIAIYTSLANVFGFVPLTLLQLLICVGSGAIGFFVFEAWKFVNSRRKRA